MTKKPWQGRFDEKTSRILEEFSESISYDRQLYPHDIRGSIAHARMLGERGIIPAPDAKLIVGELQKILAELDAGAEPWDAALEDVHMNIEALLTARIGEAGGHLHTARSRNDQVALDLTLYVKETSEAMALGILDLLEVLLTRSEEHVQTVMPGYTHLQRAQPVLLAHHLMAYFEMLRRDHGRFTALARSLVQNPLGAGALAGTPHPIDRHQTAAELGFTDVTRNSMDTVSNRDFAVEFLFTSALAQVHLSRLAEEIILWATAEFSFVTLPDAFATGSSMMPQKKNPDSAELVRGKTGRTIGNLTSLLVSLKGLPMTYNRDLQEDKEPVFDSARTLAGSLKVMTGLVGGLLFRDDVMARAADDGFSTATDLADHLVEKGVPFRQAHEITGNLVALCLELGCGLPALEPAEIKKRCDLIDEGIFEVLDVRSSIRRRDVVGGTAHGQVAKALEEARDWLGTVRGS